MDGTLGFIDLLGFSNMVDHNEDKAKKVLSDFYNISFLQISKFTTIKGHLFSDSLIVYSKSNEDIINCLSLIYQDCLLKNENYNEISKFYLLPRGAVCDGAISVEKRNTNINLSKNFIISPPLVHTAKLETQIKGSRLLVAIKNDDKNDDKNNIKYNWNRNIRFPLYKDEVLKYKKDYQYRDVLWFSSFDEEVNSKANLIKLINVTVKLLKASTKDIKTLQHYTWTLRIGLLSYSKYLGKNDDEIINMLITDFNSDEYWLIWITLIEMIVTSATEWKYTNEAKIIDFYKQNCFKKGWGKLIEEINKPGQEYALNCYKKFIDEMNIPSV